MIRICFYFFVLIFFSFSVFAGCDASNGIFYEQKTPDGGYFSTGSCKTCPDGSVISGGESMNPPPWWYPDYQPQQCPVCPAGQSVNPSTGVCYTPPPVPEGCPEGQHRDSPTTPCYTSTPDTNPPPVPCGALELGQLPCPDTDTGSGSGSGSGGTDSGSTNPPPVPCGALELGQLPCPDTDTDTGDSGGSNQCPDGSSKLPDGSCPCGALEIGQLPCPDTDADTGSGSGQDGNTTVDGSSGNGSSGNGSSSGDSDTSSYRCKDGSVPVNNDPKNCPSTTYDGGDDDDTTDNDSTKAGDLPLGSGDSDKTRVPKIKKDIPNLSTTQSISGSGSCPADEVLSIRIMGFHHELRFSWSPFCQFAIKVKPIVLLSAALAALFIVFI